MKRFIACIFVVLLLLGCAGKPEAPTPTEPTTKPEQVLTIGYCGFGNDLNIETPKTMDFLPEMLLLERLVDYRDGKLIPQLAESWEIKDNGKMVIFHLKKGIKFSDGSEFNADAVKFTIDRLNALKYYHWTEVDRIETVEIIDPYTVAIHYKEGQNGYIDLVAFAEFHLGIISPNSVEPKGNLTGKIVNPIGTGPWKVGEYVKNQYAIFVPNEYYHGEKPKLEKLVVKIIPDAETKVLALRSGEIDAIVDHYHGGSYYTPRNVLKSLQDEGFVIYKNEIPMTTILAFNYEKSPWDNELVRKAVNYAINRDEISQLFDGWVRGAEGALYCGKAPYVKDVGIKYEYNPEKAKELLKEAGYESINAKLILRGENPDKVKLAELIQAQLKKVGINVEIEVLESGPYKERQNKGEYDLRFYYVGGPERRIYQRTDGRFNPDAPEFKYGAFEDNEIANAVRKAVLPFDEKDRKEGWIEFYNLVHDKDAVVPLYYDSIFIVAKKNVKGIKFVGEPDFSSVWIE
jgi:peptide/nickel transport system substrate-binding protein